MSFHPLFLSLIFFLLSLILLSSTSLPHITSSSSSSYSSRSATRHVHDDGSISLRIPLKRHEKPHSPSSSSPSPLSPSNLVENDVENTHISSEEENKKWKRHFSIDREELHSIAAKSLSLSSSSSSSSPKLHHIQSSAYSSPSPLPLTPSSLSHHHHHHKDDSLTSSSSNSHSHHHKSSHSDSTVIVLTDYYNVMYTAELHIGSPPQTFNVITDTGSSCLWVMSVLHSPKQKLHSFIHYYDHTKSETYRAYHQEKQMGIIDIDMNNNDNEKTNNITDTLIPSPSPSIPPTPSSSPSSPPDVHLLHHVHNPLLVGDPWDIQYGVGRCKGFLSNDTISLSSLSVSSQIFAESTELTGNFMNPHQPMDGILGLAFKGGACSNWRTFLDNLKYEGKITHKMFSFYLAQPSLGVDRSEMVIGQPIPSLFDESTFVYTNVLHAEGKSPAMWFVKLGGLNIRNRHAGRDILNVCTSYDDPCVALPDTGTSFLTVPTSIWPQLVTTITAGRDDCLTDENNNVFCLNGHEGLPEIQFIFEGRPFTLRARDYVLSNNQLAFQMLDFGVKGVEVIILGDVFLRAIYTVFDADGQRVGFAEAKDLKGKIEWIWLLLGAIPLTLTLCLCGHWMVQMWRKRGMQQEYTEIPQKA